MIKSKLKKGKHEYPVKMRENIMRGIKMGKIVNYLKDHKPAAVGAVIALIVVIAIIILIACFAVRVYAEKSGIGTVKAENIALADAGEERSDVMMDYSEFDFEKGKFVYEVKFHTNYGGFEYLIRSKNGEIVGKEFNPYDFYTGGEAGIDPAINSGGTNTSEGNQENIGAPQADTTDPGLENAKSIALADAGVDANAVTVTKAETDIDNGIELYEIEFENSEYEFEYEIEKATGKIIDKSMDRKDLD